MLDVLAMVLIMLFGFAAPAGDATAQPRQSDNPVTVHTGRGAGPTRDEAAVARLLQQAERQGRIRVIVGLNMTIRDEDSLSLGEQRRQSQTLRATQDAVARRVLGSSSAKGVVRYSIIPFMSMFVDAAQLRRVFADPAVISIQEDRPVPPATGSPGHIQ